MSGVNPHEHIGLAKNAALELARRRGDSIDDHLGECYVHLDGSASRYDPSRGVDFGPYAFRSMMMGTHKREIYESGWKYRYNERERRGGWWRPPVTTSTVLAEARACARPDDGGPAVDDAVESAAWFCVSAFEHVDETHGWLVAQMIGRGLNQSEIAMSLGFTKQWVSKLVRRAREVAKEVR